MKLRKLLVILVAALGIGCGRDPGGATTPGPTFATVTLSYHASTVPRTDLPASLQACVQGATPTHTHPSWRNFAFVQLQAAGPDRWQVVFNDVPVGVVVSLRVNDANRCDENPTGAATRDIFINDVRLTTSVTTPGTGPEPGFSFRVEADGQIRP